MAKLTEDQQEFCGILLKVLRDGWTISPTRFGDSTWLEFKTPSGQVGTALRWEQYPELSK